MTTRTLNKDMITEQGNSDNPVPVGVGGAPTGPPRSSASDCGPQTAAGSQAAAGCTATGTGAEANNFEDRSTRKDIGKGRGISIEGKKSKEGEQDKEGSEEGRSEEEDSEECDYDTDEREKRQKEIDEKERKSRNIKEGFAKVIEFIDTINYFNDGLGVLEIGDVFDEESVSDVRTIKGTLEELKDEVEEIEKKYRVFRSKMRYEKEERREQEIRREKELREKEQELERKEKEFEMKEKELERRVKELEKKEKELERKELEKFIDADSEEDISKGEDEEREGMKEPMGKAIDKEKENDKDGWPLEGENWIVVGKKGKKRKKKRERYKRSSQERDGHRTLKRCSTLKEIAENEEKSSRVEDSGFQTKETEIEVIRSERSKNVDSDSFRDEILEEIVEWWIKRRRERDKEKAGENEKSLMGDDEDSSIGKGCKAEDRENRSLNDIMNGMMKEIGKKENLRNFVGFRIGGVEKKRNQEETLKEIERLFKNGGIEGTWKFVDARLDKIGRVIITGIGDRISVERILRKGNIWIGHKLCKIWRWNEEYRRNGIEERTRNERRRYSMYRSESDRSEDRVRRCKRCGKRISQKQEFFWREGRNNSERGWSINRFRM